MFLRKVRKKSEEETGRESAGVDAEGTLRLAELIAVMEWSYSPEHRAATITQQDDFSNLHVRRL